MNVSLGPRWESFVEKIVQSGRYKSSSEVVREGLRLVEEREAALSQLRQEIQDALARGGRHTHEEVWTRIEKRIEDAAKNLK